MADTPTIIYGNVNADGTKKSGTDNFRSEKIDEGLYSVNFEESFSTVPGVSVTEVFPGDNQHGGNTKDNAVLVLVANDRCRVKTGNDDGHARDREFSFIAIGY